MAVNGYWPLGLQVYFVVPLLDSGFPESSFYCVEMFWNATLEKTKP